MSVEQAIHQRWKTCRPLSDLLPADRFRTGHHFVPAAGDDKITLPYATLERSARGEVHRLSGGVQLHAIVMTFRIWCDDLASAKKVASEIDHCYGRQSFDVGEISIQDMKLSGQEEVSQKDGMWRLQLDYGTRFEIREKS